MGLHADIRASSIEPKEIRLLMVTGSSLSATLEKKGYRSVGVQAYIASNLVEVKKALSRYSIDALLIDWEYQAIDPFEIMKFIEASKMYHHIPVVITSVHRCDDRIGEYKGVALFVKQPVPRVIILERIRRLLQRDHRESERLPLKEFYLGRVKVKLANETLTMALADISMSGIFLYSETSLEHGQELHLDFSLPGVDAPLDIEGKVIRVARMHKINDKMNKGIAIQFTKFNGKTEEVLSEFLKTYKPDTNFMSYYF
jgi:hypothetical protein